MEFSLIEHRILIGFCIGYLFDLIVSRITEGSSFWNGFVGLSLWTIRSIAIVIGER